MNCVEIVLAFALKFYDQYGFVFDLLKLID